MQMGVKDLLERGFPVSQEQVDPLAAESRGAERLDESHGDYEHPRPGCLIQIGQVRSVSLRDDQEVARRNRPDIHEGKQIRVVIDDARRGTTSDDRAEDAIGSAVSCGSGQSRRGIPHSELLPLCRTGSTGWKGESW